MLHNTNLIKYKTCSEKKKQYGVCISHIPKYWLHIILICCRMFEHFQQLTFVRDFDLGLLIFLFSGSKFLVNVIFKVSMSTLFHGKLDLEQRTVSLY